MGKNIKYGEFTFPSSPARPTGMKDGGMCAPAPKYAKGGPKVKAKREPEAMVRKEVALLRKAGAPKALVSHEVREIKGKMDTPATKKAEVGMMRKAKGGAVEAKLEKHANMPAAKAHGPGAGNKLAKGGVPTFSKVPKFGQMG